MVNIKVTSKSLTSMGTLVPNDGMNFLSVNFLALRINKCRKLHSSRVKVLDESGIHIDIIQLLACILSQKSHPWITPKDSAILEKAMHRAPE